MGLFSGIKKAVKGIFRGIKKAFKSAVSSKLGKLVMTAAAIYTGGLAISGGVQGWSAAASNGAGFMGKFVAGAEGFMTTLFNPIEATKNIAAGGGPLSAGQMSQIAPSVAGEAAQGVAELATGTAESAAISGAAQGVAPAAAKVAAPVAKAAATAPAAEGWLGKAAGFAKDFLLSPTGASMIEGFAAGGAREEEMKFEDRINRQWADPNNAFQKQMKGGGLLSGTINRGAPPIFNPGGQAPQGGSSIVPTSGRLPGEPLPA